MGRVCPVPIKPERESAQRFRQSIQAGGRELERPPTRCSPQHGGPPNECIAVVLQGL